MATRLSLVLTSTLAGADPAVAQYLSTGAPAANPVPMVSGATASGGTGKSASPVADRGDLFSFRPPLAEAGVRLAEHGVYLRGFVQDTAYSVASGGRQRGALDYGEAFYGADLDLQRLVGWKDAILSISLDTRLGAPPARVGEYSGSALGFIQGVGPSSKTRLNELTIDQHLYQDRIRVIVGRQTLADYFATSTLYCQFEVGLCSNLVPSILGGDTSAPFWPIAVWAGEASFWPTKNLYARIGASESNPAQYARGGFPWNKGWSTRGATGAFVPAEVGYVTTPDRARYFGRAALGVTFDSSNFPDARIDEQGRPLAVFGGTPRRTGSATTIYGQAERMVWRPDASAARGLSLLAGAEYQIDGHGPIKAYLTGGAVFSGLLAARPSDSAGLLVQHHRLGDEQVGYLEDLLAARNRSVRLSRSETIIEANYEVQVARGIRIKPYGAYIVHPDQLGNSNPDPALKHALLVGARVSLYLNPALGLAQLSRPN